MTVVAHDAPRRRVVEEEGDLHPAAVLPSSEALRRGAGGEVGGGGEDDRLGGPGGLPVWTTVTARRFGGRIV
jgi:hypothetical protein